MPGDESLNVARKVFQTEVRGLEALDEWLGEEFLNAVDLINKCEGRVVVSGMGKSGHIAKKIAATFASTGTPAQFVHPAEASHGDLGMVTKKDVVMLLSNSGETKELQDIIYYTRRFSIPLIGIVRRKASALVDAADVALVLPEIEEACQINAPTTSTTMMLALGDALAITMVERHGFSKEDFHLLHPGGKLGSSLLKVEKLMHQADAMPIVKADSPMKEVLIEISAKSLGCVGVIDDNGALLGIITDGDLRRHMSDDIISKQASDIMTKDPITIKPSSIASQVLQIMEDKKITNLFVVDDVRPVGVVHVHDLLRSGVA